MPPVLMRLFAWPMLPRAAAITSTLLVAWLIYMVARRALTGMVSRQRLSQPMARIVLRFTRWLMAPIVLLLVLHEAGFDIQGLWAPISAVLAMIAVAFVAVWSVVSNVLCTLLIIAFRPFRIGDRIELLEPTGTTGLKGTVIDLTFMHATLEEPPDEEGNLRVVKVPTSLFFQKAVRRTVPAHD